MAFVQVVPVGLVDNIDRGGVFGVVNSIANRGVFSVCIGSTSDWWTVLTTELYLASVQVVPVAVVDSTDRGGAFSFCTGSTIGCGGRYRRQRCILRLYR